MLEGPLPEALKRAVKFAFNREAVFVRDGGTIGAMTSIEKVLKCPVLFLGLSLPEQLGGPGGEAYRGERNGGDGYPGDGRGVQGGNRSAPYRRPTEKSAGG